MKVRLGELRKIVREEYMRGVPDYILRDLSHKFIDGVRMHVSRYIAATQKDPISARRATDLTNKTLKELEDLVNQALEDKLWQIKQQT